MTLNRSILVFLGFIFLIIVILSSRQIAGVLRQRFGGFIPALKPTAEKVTPTPTPFIIAEETPTPTPPTVFTGGEKGAVPSEIPATGPEDLAWLVLGGSFLTGISLKKVTRLLGRRSPSVHQG